MADPFFSLSALSDQTDRLPWEGRLPSIPLYPAGLSLYRCLQHSSGSGLVLLVIIVASGTFLDCSGFL